MSRRALTIVFVVSLLSIGSTVATAAELKFPTTNPAGVLHPGDVVEFTVYDLYGPGVATPLTVRLDEQGRVKLPMIDEVAVAGQTNDAAGLPVAKAYKAAQIVSGPMTITVAIVATAAQMPVKPGPLARGDTLRLTVFDLTGPGKRTDADCAIAADGTITAPLAGQVKVAGLSDGDASRAIAKAYKDAQIITNASVIVLRTTSGS